MAKCELCGKKMWFEVPYKIDGKSLCSECAEGESKKKQEVQEISEQPKPKLPLLENVEKIEFRNNETSVTITTKEGSKDFGPGIFRSIEEKVEFAKKEGMNKWELKLEIDEMRGWMARLICTKGDEFEFVRHMLIEPKWWIIGQLMGIGLGCIYCIKLIRINEIFYSAILAVFLLLFFSFSFLKELILFGDINGRWFLAYPKIILNSQGIKYLRGKETCFIPWEDVSGLTYSSIVRARNFSLGITIYSSTGRKVTIPAFFPEFDQIFINNIVQWAGLIETDRPTNWFKRWIYGIKWSKALQKELVVIKPTFKR